MQRTEPGPQWVPRVSFMTMRTDGFFLELMLGLGTGCGPSTSSFEILCQVAQPGEAS